MLEWYETVCMYVCVYFTGSKVEVVQQSPPVVGGGGGEIPYIEIIVVVVLTLTLTLLYVCVV